MTNKDQKALHSKLEDLKHVFGFEGWDIKLEFDSAIDGYGNCATNDPYHYALIKLHPEIKDPASNNPQLDTLYHELGELLMHEPIWALPDGVRVMPEFDKYRDYLADRVGRIIQRLLGDI